MLTLYIQGRARRHEFVQTALLKFARDRSGSVAVVFGLIAMCMLCIMGAAIDYGRWLHARDQTLNAIDSAVLAAGRALQVNPGDEDAALAIAQKYYTENTRTRPALVSDTIIFKTEDHGLSVTAEGAAYIGTTLLRLAQIDKLPLFELSGAEFSKAVLAVGGNADTNLEVALMLDTSGSMGSNTKFQDMKEAATDLVNIVVWEDQSSHTSKVSIAPFSADMSVPASYLNDVRGPGPFDPVSYTYTCGSKKSGYGTCTGNYTPSPCVAERTGAEKYTDAAPGEGKYVMPVLTSNSACSQSKQNEMMPLTNDKSVLTTKINDLQLGGGTAGHLGTAWAWYTLSPNWNQVWPSNPAAAYGVPNTKKIAILMTDGEYNTQYDANGVKTGSAGAGPAVNASSVEQAKALCDGMKTAGITVYTVGFDLGGNQTAIATLEYCATDQSKFYNADGGDELKQAFRDIALQLSTLHLSR